MKVRKLKVINYKSISAINLDFTYPVGHKNHGYASDKVCFIGQSGTGKTQLLYLIMQLSILGPNGNLVPENFPEESVAEIEFEVELDKVFLFFEKSIKAGKVSFKTINIIDKQSVTPDFTSEKKERSRSLKEVIDSYFNTIHTYFFSAQADYLPARAYYQSILGSNRDGKKVDSISNFYDLHFNQCIFSYLDTANLAFSAFKDKINSYDLKERDMRVNASYHAEEGGDILEYIRQWKLENINPNALLSSESLIHLLEDINLSVEFDASEDEGDIVFRNTSNNFAVSIEELSSGARQLISTALPLLIHQPTSSLILIDEPESSLYPSIQLKVVPFFTNIGQDNQIILATHSPIVASYFEPWEIIELKFAEDKSVYVEDNLLPLAERAVGNYRVDARYLTWTSILTRLFEIGQNSNEEMRTPILMKLAKIRSRISEARGNPNSIAELQELTQEFVRLSNLVDWKGGI